MKWLNKESLEYYQIPEHEKHKEVHNYLGTLQNAFPKYTWKECVSNIGMQIDIWVRCLEGTWKDYRITAKIDHNTLILRFKPDKFSNEVTLRFSRSESETLSPDQVIMEFKRKVIQSMVSSFNYHVDQAECKMCVLKDHGYGKKDT